MIRILLQVWQDLTCSHHWVRARLEDGRYGLRCMDCFKLYPRTWNDLIGQPAPNAQARVSTAGQWRRAAIATVARSENAIATTRIEESLTRAA